ncbi:MAG: ATP-binding protein [Myxococcales bacterium]
MSAPLLTVELRRDEDVVLARQRTRQLAAVLGFDPQEQTRLATAISEIARNAVRYARGGRLLLAFDDASQALRMEVVDEGPGIPDLDDVLQGRHRSAGGMGILGARRLMDEFAIDSGPGGTTVRMLRRLPPRRTPLHAAEVAERVATELLSRPPPSAVEELQQQNRETLSALAELQNRQAELVRMSRELEETNRGVVALYAELDERADFLKRTSDLKSRFLSNMSHEFRTPLNSILSLSRLLLDRVDGELTDEQEKQVLFIRRSAEALSELVNDLLDLARIEAGKTVVRAAEFEVRELFATLRGMLRPVQVHEAVQLVFEEPSAAAKLRTDEGKVSQILRNLVSNALKFTEEGEVRVSAEQQGALTLVHVADTGIGIAEEDQHRVFEEFTQVDSAIQKRVKGTGLGLPLSRKLARLLGGDLTVRSTPGRGSVFTLAIPTVYGGPSEVGDADAMTLPTPDPTRSPVLVIEDDAETALLYEKFLRGSRFQAIPARTIEEARQALARFRPVAIILDVLLQGQSAWGFLEELKRGPLQELPVFVVTVAGDADRARALGAEDFLLKPLDRKWLLDRLGKALPETRRTRILVVDDDEVSRYLVASQLAGPDVEVVEAASGEQGLRRARDEAPAAIVLDLVMPDLSGTEVLERLRADPATAGIPVVINTSRKLEPPERAALAERTLAVLDKNEAAEGTAAPTARDVLVAAGVLRESGGAK